VPQPTETSLTTLVSPSTLHLLLVPTVPIAHTELFVFALMSLDQATAVDQLTPHLVPRKPSTMLNALPIAAAFHFQTLKLLDHVPTPTAILITRNLNLAVALSAILN